MANLNVVVVHLLGGQIVIGARGGDQTVGGPVHLVNPHEVMVTPPVDGLRAQVSLVPYGSALGILPGLTIGLLRLMPLQMLSAPNEPPPDLKNAYLAAVSKSEAEAARIAGVFKASQTDITKDGTL